MCCALLPVARNSFLSDSDFPSIDAQTQFRQSASVDDPTTTTSSSSESSPPFPYCYPPPRPVLSSH